MQISLHSSTVGLGNQFLLVLLFQKLHHEMLADRPRTLAYKKAIEDARSFIQDKVNTLVFSELHLWNKHHLVVIHMFA